MSRAVLPLRDWPRAIHDLPVQRKLGLLTLVASTLALVLAASVYSVYQLDALRNDRLRETGSLAELLVERVRLALRTEPPGGLDDALNALGQDARLRAATVYAEDGSAVAAFQRDERGSWASVATPVPSVDDGLHVTRVIREGSEVLGTVDLHADLAGLYARMLRDAAVGAVVMLISFLLAMRLTRGIRGDITDPLEGLARRVGATIDPTTGRPTMGDGVPPRGGQGNEIEVLARAFNGLVAGIEDRDRQIRASEQRLRALVEHAADAFFLLSPSGDILDVNRQACDMLGTNRETLLSENLARLDPGFDLAAVRELPAAPEYTRSIALPGELTAAGGRRVRVETRVGCFEADGRRYLLALVRDTTERERIMGELEQARSSAEAASRFKSRFLSSLSHEIRTPMTSVLGVVDVLDRSHLDPEQRRCVQLVRRSGDALLALIDDLLELSWIDAGRISADSLELDVPALVEQVVDVFAQRAHGKGLELGAYIDPAVPAALRGDPRHLRQVLMHLLGNAVKFTDRGEVCVRVEPDPGPSMGASGTVRVRFTISDSGIGVPPELAPRLFEPFEQGDDSPPRQRGGTGIGLAIAQALVRAMGGEIGLEPRDVGSAFWFTATFGVRPTPTRSPQEPEDDGDGWSVAGRQVLVIDDNPAMRAVLCDQLAAHGLQPTAASDGFSALELLRAGGDRTRRPALIMVEHTMAGRSCADLVAELRASVGTEVTIVVLTALGDRVDTEALEAAGVNGYLSKPVRQSCLPELLRAIPAAPLAADTPSPLPAPESGRQRSVPRRVLLADDDESVRDAMSMMLRVLGYDVDCVRNGREAVDAFERRDYDAVLMDCQMPEVDGYGATRLIRRREAAGRRVPILAVTGLVIEGERDRCLAAGMDEFLSKPVPMGILEAVLDGLLSRNGRGGSPR
ncbi:MAG: response regulator [Ectothiorhodospiraceae bacterium]|nr:response regulator [Chromatiales bacterium]MCP5154581.1 response regulator [Ectothiorhodospiraceae bacterium]